MPKEYKTIDEQIEILRNRGLTINDEEVAKDFLKFNNYYRISGYSLTLRKDDKFYPSVSMQDIINIYRFDQEFRSCLFNIITKIEINFRSIIVHYFAQKHGALGYRDKNNFIETKKLTYEKVFEKTDESVRRNIKSELCLQHYIEIKEDFPLWVYIGFFTFSDLSKFYTIMEVDIQKKVASEFGFNSNNGNDIISSHLHCFTFLRNICAHGGRLFNRSFNTRPMLSKAEKALSKNNPNNARLFGFILKIKSLARADDWKSFLRTLVSICDEYPSVDMSYYGFCNDWKEYL